MSPLVVPGEAREDVTYEIELSPQTADSVLQLLETGLFGETQEAVVEEMVRHRVRELILERWIS